MGTAVAVGIESRDCRARVSVKCANTNRTAKIKNNFEQSDMSSGNEWLDRPADAQLAHPGLERGALHAEEGRSAFGACDAPLGLA